MYHASKRLKSQESWQFRKSVHATFPTVTLYWGSKGWIPKSPMQLSIEERNCWETFCVSRLVEQYVLARRDKRFLILFSEGLTREAGHHFRCMKHFAILWNTYGDALFTLENFINSYMWTKETRYTATGGITSFHLFPDRIAPFSFSASGVVPLLFSNPKHIWRLGSTARLIPKLFWQST